MGRLFGTDGIRGVANTELSCELALKIGRAAAIVLTQMTNGRKPKFLIGKDSRISGDMLESALSAGLCSIGADVTLLGILPTPAVAFLVKKYNYDAAIMISASHNPCEYNGIKIFKNDGFKLPDCIEEEIEAIILDDVDLPPLKTHGEIGTVDRCKNAIKDYVEHLKTTIDTDLNGLKIAFDCANGASSESAQLLFSSLCDGCHFINNAPNGTNINKNCGSTHLESLKKYVKENNLDGGFAFDGDADRLLIVDENGEEVDGDQIIAFCADYMKQKGTLKKDTAVVTVMTNMGFNIFCKENEINVASTKVGDRYVLQEMLEHGYCIGGEQSGHVIFLDYATTGDGELTALQVLKIMKKTGKSLSELASVMKIYPQVLINVKVSNMGKARLFDDKEIKIAIDQAEKELENKGRVLVRVSGTEPLVRVMLEGEDENQINVLAREIATVIKERLL